MRQTKSILNISCLLFLFTSHLHLFAGSISETTSVKKGSAKDVMPPVSYNKNFNLKDFDQLKIGSAFTVNVYPGEKFAVKVSGKPEDVEDVQAEVISGELIVRFKENKIRLRIKEVVTVDITMPLLKAVNFSGTSSSVVFPGFTAGNFVAYVSGTAYAEINMNAREMFLDATGACTLKMIGQANQLKVNANGTAVVDAFELSAEEAILDVSGTSSSKIQVVKTIKANASGASSIRYRGEAKLLVADTSRLSTIKKIQ